MNIYYLEGQHLNWQRRVGAKCVPIDIILRMEPCLDLTFQFLLVLSRSEGIKGRESHHGSPIHLANIGRPTGRPVLTPQSSSHPPARRTPSSLSLCV